MPFLRSKCGKFVKKSVQEKLDKIRASKLKPVESSSFENVCSGRRIVELTHLGQELWCLVCDIPLSLRNIIEEQRMGLISLLKVQCLSCQACKMISTGKRSMLDNSNVYDANMKAAVGLCDAGIGPSQFHTLLSALNIPTPSEGLWKRHERLIGPAMESLAKESCQEAVALEKSLSLSSPISLIPSPSANAGDQLHTSTPVVKIAASYDMGWQKRGNGKSYDSLTGHASLIGLKSKKILNFGVRSKICRKCYIGKPQEDHDCRKNFSGSAKAMESDLAVELANSPSLKQLDVELGVFIGDDDSSTLSALRKGYSSDIEKWSDLNHAKKCLVSLLYGMQKNHKDMNSKVIAYLKRCFSYALLQNKGDVEGTRRAIANVVGHAFDDHANCGSWCGYVYDSESYKHKGLPGGKCLKGDLLRISLFNVFNKFAGIADKLAPCGSSQGNESFNAMVAAKAPKSKHYGGSESLGYRVAAAVNQKNLGAKYIIRLNEKLALSPGQHGEKYRVRNDFLRMRKSINKAKLIVKRRRLFLKQNRGQREKKLESKEGVTYCSYVSLVPKASFEKKTIKSNSNIVFVDLETSGFGKSAEILQIAAKCGENLFSIYAMPERNINFHASEATGLSIIGKALCYRNTPVLTTSLKDCLSMFLDFLGKFGKPVILVGHNLLKFDIHFLIRAVKQHSLINAFEKFVAGFADTLPLFKKIIPGKESYKQVSLAKEFLLTFDEESAHNAEYDVKVLNELVSSLKIEQETIILAAIPYVEYVNREENKKKVLATKDSLNPLRKKGISSIMINKLASLHISYQDLAQMYDSGGEKGLILFFCEDVGGQPRITKNPKILASVISLFK